MADWVEKLDAFLKFNEYDVLKKAGKVSHEVAKELAEQQYESFRIVQDRSFESDLNAHPRSCSGRSGPLQKRRSPNSTELIGGCNDRTDNYLPEMQDRDSANRISRRAIGRGDPPTV